MFFLIHLDKIGKIQDFQDINFELFIQQVDDCIQQKKVSFFFPKVLTKGCWGEWPVDGWTPIWDATIAMYQEYFNIVAREYPLDHGLPYFILAEQGKNMKLGTLFLLSHEIFDLWKGQFTFDHLHQFKSREKSITSVKYLLAAIIHMNKYGKMNVQSIKGKYEALLRKKCKKVFLAGAQFRMKTCKLLTSIILPQSFHI